MITLTLLHPIQSIPVQSWTFEHESVIRIGRSTDNHVILYSAVVSRHHVELRNTNGAWELVNLGANGTYLDGKRVNQMPVEDGLIVRLARSGPNVQIHLGPKASQASAELSGEKTVGQRLEPLPDVAAAPGEPSEQPSPPMTEVSLPPPLSARPRLGLQTVVEDDDRPEASPSSPSLSLALLDCCRRYEGSDLLFCLDCGRPLHVRQLLGAYPVIKTLSQDATTLTHLVWRDGQSLMLRTLKPDALSPVAVADFTAHAQQLLQAQHPALPVVVDFFMAEDYPCLVMEPLYGQSLQRLVSIHGPVPLRQAVSWLLQVCDVLEYLHQLTPPFLHRQLKPEHLIRRGFTSSEYDITLVGFSLFEAPEDVEPLVRGGYTLAELDRKAVDVDLYALAPTLAYLLTGKPPISFYAQREQGFRFYPEYVPGLTPELTGVLRRLTHPQPSDRYTCVAELSDDLHHVLVTET